MKQIVFLLPLILLLSSTRAIEVGWNDQDDQDDLDNQDEFIVGGGGVDLQTSSDSALRLTNGIFDLYRLLSSDNQKLNQIVSNVKQTVGKDTYAVNHVFKHIKNGNYYLELDTDKYNFAVTFVRMPNTKHIHDNDSDHPSTTTPPSTSKPSKTTPPPSTEPSKTTPPPSTEPSKTTPPPSTEPSKTTPPSTNPSKTTTPPSTEPSKTTPPPSTEPSKTTTPSTNPSKTTTPPSTEPSKTTPPPSTEPSKTTPPPSTKPSKTTPPSTTEPSKTIPPPSTNPSKTTPPSTKPSRTTPPSSTAKPVNATQIQQEAEKLRRLEDKRFRQILGQWHLAGVKTGEWFDDVDYKACQVITIYTHGNNYFLKTLNNAGNDTYKMTDEHIESVDKKNNVFKLNNNVYRYKTVLLQGKNYKIKLFQLSNLNNSTDVSFYTEHPVDRTFISKVFADHYADLKLFTIEQDCD
jgi:hypothetical protein